MFASSCEWGIIYKSLLLATIAINTYYVLRRLTSHHGMHCRITSAGGVVKHHFTV